MSKRNKNPEFWNTTAMNQATFQMYLSRLTQLAMSTFEWKNVPEGVDVRFLELGLLTKGYSLFFRDDELDQFLSLNGTIGGTLNVYNIPTSRVAMASNGYNRNLNDTDSVIVYNNLLHTPSEPDLALFAHRLYDLDRSIDVNARAQKTPIAIICEESQRLSLINLYRQYDGNAPFIMGTSGLNLEGIRTVNTGAPFVAKELYELKTKIWNEALTYLGISNVSEQKRERMVTDEVNRSMGGVMAQRFSRLEARREACRQINTMFGLNMECNWRDVSTVEPLTSTEDSVTQEVGTNQLQEGVTVVE